MTNTFIILDIDNCIADDSWRIPKIRWDIDDLAARYHEYHALSIHDNCHNKHLFNNFPEHKIIVATSRPSIYRERTMIWLVKNGVLPFSLLMRPVKSTIPSLELKEQFIKGLRFIGVNLDEVVAAYDDREDIVEMYKSFGIYASVEKIHDVFAYKKPSGGK